MESSKPFLVEYYKDNTNSIPVNGIVNWNGHNRFFRMKTSDHYFQLPRIYYKVYHNDEWENAYDMKNVLSSSANFHRYCDTAFECGVFQIERGKIITINQNDYELYGSSYILWDGKVAGWFDSNLKAAKHLLKLHDGKLDPWNESSWCSTEYWRACGPDRGVKDFDGELYKSGCCQLVENKTIDLKIAVAKLLDWKSKEIKRC